MPEAWVDDALQDEGRWSVPLFLSWIRAPWHRPVAIHLARKLASRGIRRVRARDAQLEPLARTIESLMPREKPDLSMLRIDWSPLGASELGVRWIASRLDAAVAEVRVDGRDVIVKQSFSPERARHEHRVLTRLSSVPRVLLWDAGHATIVMEPAPGVSLDRLFAMGDVAQLMHGVTAAGRWLVAMQRETRSASDPRAMLDLIVDTAIRDADVMGRDRARVVRRLRALKKDAPFVTGHHGDYWPGNIFIDGARATVIDLEGFREGLPLEDVAYFLIRADMLRRRFRVRAPHLAEAFFEGYGETPDRDALALFTLTKGLRTLANDTGGNLPLPQRLWTRRTIRNAIRRALC
jgi:hypothetical protein